MTQNIELFMGETGDKGDTGPNEAKGISDAPD
jgi:hypothetical protein